jgi:hypothetical protein
MPPIAQNNWRFCSKCYCLWFNGLSNTGVCPAGGGHSALATPGGPAGPPSAPKGGPASWNFILIANPRLFGSPLEE